MSVLRSMRATIRSPGFTLVEAAVVIAIIGIVGSILTVFFQGAVTSYFSSVRRAQLSDVADSALRRIARDIQTALPNSARADATGYFLEFIPVKSGGRYRASPDGGTNALDVSNAADNNFDVLGPAVSIAAGDKIVIYNTGQSGANAYLGQNIRAFSSLAGSTITFAGTQFPRDSDSYRFQVVNTPVTYACDAASGTLWRYTGYAIQAAQPATLSASLLVTGSGNVAGAVLATNVVCAAGANIGTGFDVRNADGLVTLRIQLTDSSGETINLWREVHVDNTP